jgi:murein tripeptide amidase MpaA
MPYVETNWREFLRDYVGRPEVKLETLGRTRKGRPVELLEISPPNGDADYQILITCRHHACETMANYALEGLIQRVLGDSTQGRSLRWRTKFCIVPFIDKDGVEEGDQGKLRAPHDHWLDYGSTSRYSSVGELRKRFEGGVMTTAPDCRSERQSQTALENTAPGQR